MKVLMRASLSVAIIFVLTSCGDQKCELIGVKVAPASATASHLSAAPANGVRFAANGDYQGKCVLPACVDCLPGVTWSVSDTANISLVPDSSGTSAIRATCNGATNGPVTITAKTTNTAGTTVSGTATLTCQ